MVDDSIITLLKQRMQKANNYPMILLGAGFSIGAVSQNGKDLVLGKDLAKNLYDAVIKKHWNELTSDEQEESDFYQTKGKLLELCGIIEMHKWNDERNRFLISNMKGCHPKVSLAADPDYIDFGALTTYPWPYIFTLNVDDFIENIYALSGKECKTKVRNQKEFKIDPLKTTLIKLHGCINLDREHIVFSPNEYNRFIRPENILLTKFGEEWFSRDVIVIGTQFQEYDLKNTIGLLEERGYSNKECQYFFISPGKYNIEIQGWIDNYDNFHHIEWTNKEFLNFLRSEITLSVTKKSMLTGNYFTCWNDDIASAKQENEYNHDLYYGRAPKAGDFIHSYDIERYSDKNEHIAYDFTSILRSGKSMAAILAGNVYVGKTCMALRMLTICEREGFSCYYTRRLDYESIQRIINYLSSAEKDEKLALCLEDASGYYKDFSMLFNTPSNRGQLVIIATADLREHKTKLHNLDTIDNIKEYYLSEKIEKRAIDKIYIKLHEKKQLGELQRKSDNIADIKGQIKAIGDFMDVLYVAHHGQSFKEYFKDWYSQKSEVEYLAVFKMLVCMSSLGAKRLTPFLLSQLAEIVLGDKFKYEMFQEKFGQYVVEESGFIRLHCTRLLSDIVLSDVSKEDFIKWVKSLLSLLGKQIKERDTNYCAQMFESVSKSRNILSITGLKDNVSGRSISVSDGINILRSVEKECEHLSYYWIQLSILYRDNEQFEEAVNAILNAQNRRGYRTYQIAHADAKNYMTWGLREIKNGKTDDNSLFIKGQEILRKLIDDKHNYPGCLGFSVHTYVNMTLQYYKITNFEIEPIEWMKINEMLKRYVQSTSYQDHAMTNLLKEVREFAKGKGLSVDNIVYLQKQLNEKRNRLLFIEDYESDNVPGEDIMH